MFKTLDDDDYDNNRSSYSRGAKGGRRPPLCRVPVPIGGGVGCRFLIVVLTDILLLIRDLDNLTNLALPGVFPTNEKKYGTGGFCDLFLAR